MAAEGARGAGVAQLRQGLEAMKSLGAELRLPFYYGLLAQVYGLAGQEREALANIGAALAFQNKNGELWWSAELERLHQDLVVTER
jgi:predicted ATPase